MKSFDLQFSIRCTCSGAATSRPVNRRLLLSKDVLSLLKYQILAPNVNHVVHHAVFFTMQHVFVNKLANPVSKGRLQAFELNLRRVEFFECKCWWLGRSCEETKWDLQRTNSFHLLQFSGIIVSIVRMKMDVLKCVGCCYYFCNRVHKLR